jgi:hypothetical protein
MKMIYRTASVFRPVGEKTWWALKKTGKGMYDGVKWVVPYAAMATSNAFHAVKDGYKWLTPRLRVAMPMVFEKAKELASRTYHWAVPHVRYLSPLVMSSLSSDTVVLNPIMVDAMGVQHFEEEAELPPSSTDMTYFINLSVPGWDKIVPDLIEAYKDLTIIFRLPDESIARVGFKRSSFKRSFALLSGIGMKFGTEFADYPVSILEVLAPREVQIRLNEEGPEHVEGYIKGLSYYREVIANLPVAQSIIEEKIPVETMLPPRDRERD